MKNKLQIIAYENIVRFGNQYNLLKQLENISAKIIKFKINIIY